MKQNIHTKSKMKKRRNIKSKTATAYTVYFFSLIDLSSLLLLVFVFIFLHIDSRRSFHIFFPFFFISFRKFCCWLLSLTFISTQCFSAVFFCARRIFISFGEAIFLCFVLHLYAIHTYECANPISLCV